MTDSNIELVVDSNSDNVTTKFSNDAFGVSFLQKGFFDEKEEVKFIKKVESQIRSSPEYRDFISYLKNELSFNYCSFFNKLDSDDVTIEIHHHPFTLFDLVEAEIMRHVDNKLSFNTFSISFYVMRAHYANVVGLVPLSKTMHELAHSSTGNIVIPRELIIGNYVNYYKEYENHLSDRAKEKYVAWLSDTDNLTDYDKNRVDPDRFIDNKIRERQIEVTKLYSLNEHPELLEKG